MIKKFLKKKMEERLVNGGLHVQALPVCRTSVWRKTTNWPCCLTSLGTAPRPLTTLPPCPPPHSRPASPATCLNSRCKVTSPANATLQSVREWRVNACKKVSAACIALLLTFTPWSWMGLCVWLVAHLLRVTCSLVAFFPPCQTASFCNR